MKKSLIILAAAALSFAACNKAVLNTQEEAGVGYISFAMTSDDVVVSTKAVTEEQLNEYDVILDGQWTKKYSAVKDQTFTLKVGQYNASAENMSEAAAEEGNGKLRIATSAPVSVTVSADVAATVTLPCEVQSSKLTLDYSDAFKSVFTDYTFKVEKKEGTARTLNLTEGTPVYYNGSVVLIWTLKGTHSETGEKTFTGEVSVAKKHSMLLNVDLGSSGLGITVTADDTLLDASEEITINPYN